MGPPEYNHLIRLAGLLLKYYVLGGFCFSIVCILLAGFGAFQLIGLLLAAAGPIFWRLAVFIFYLIAVGILAEAFR